MSLTTPLLHISIPYLLIFCALHHYFPLSITRGDSLSSSTSEIYHLSFCCFPDMLPSISPFYTSLHKALFLTPILLFLLSASFFCLFKDFTFISLTPCSLVSSLLFSVTLQGPQRDCALGTDMSRNGYRMGMKKKQKKKAAGVSGNNGIDPLCVRRMSFLLLQKCANNSNVKRACLCSSG